MDETVPDDPSDRISSRSASKARQNRDGRPSDGTVGPSAASGIADILSGTVGRITGHAKVGGKSPSHPAADL